MTSPAAGAEGTGQVTGNDVQPGGGSSATGQGGGGQQGNGQKTGGNGHPAWAEYLKDIPAGLHGAVTPAFQKWDTDMSAKLSQVQQQYAPWQGIIDGGAQPDQVSGALELLQMLQDDPASAIGELAQWAQSQGTDLSGLLGDQGGGGQGDGEQQGPLGDEGEDLPDWAQQLISGSKDQQQLLDLVAQKIIADGQAAEEEQAVDELESQLTPLLQQAGIQFQGAEADNDALDVIFSAMSNGASPEQAVSRWTALQQRVRGQANSANAPKVLGAGGGLPTQQVDPKTPLSQNDRRALAYQRARELMGQQGG